MIVCLVQNIVHHIYIYIFQDSLIYALFRDSALAVVRVFSWVTVLELCETNVILLDDILQDKIVDIT